MKPVKKTRGAWEEYKNCSCKFTGIDTVHQVTWCQEHVKKALADELKRVREIIIALPTPEPKPYKLQDMEAIQWKDGYNTACTDALSALEEEHE